MRIAREEDIGVRRGTVYVGYWQRLYVLRLFFWTLLVSLMNIYFYLMVYARIQFLFPFGLICLWWGISTFLSQAYLLRFLIAWTRTFIVHGAVHG